MRPCAQVQSEESRQSVEAEEFCKACFEPVFSGTRPRGVCLRIGRLIVAGLMDQTLRFPSAAEDSSRGISEPWLCGRALRSDEDAEVM